MPARISLEGDTYGLLKVVSFSHTSQNNGMSHYLCKCSCGKEKVISHGNLRSGHTISCGCQQNKTGSESPHFVHGFAKNHKTYKSWCKIKERCFNPNDISYSNYGAKGITISDELKDDFLDFYAEVGDAPGKSMLWSVDRIDNKKNYEKGNLRWAYITQQARNKGMKVTNSSGETGVQFYHSGNTNHATYAVTNWYDLTGKAMNKKFSVRKLGLMPAFKAAVEYRRQMIAELNAQGAGYTENHGK